MASAATITLAVDIPIRSTQPQPCEAVLGPPSVASCVGLRHQRGQRFIRRAAADHAYHRLAAGNRPARPHIKHRHRPQLDGLPLAPTPAQHVVDDAHS